MLQIVDKTASVGESAKYQNQSGYLKREPNLQGEIHEPAIIAM